MLNSIREFFDARLGGGASTGATGDEQRSDSDIQMASAALLIELGRCDTELDDRESLVILDKLRRAFSLSDATLEQLVRLADEQLRQATDLYQFTSLVNEHYCLDDKLRLLENMWRVAYADHRVSDHEEHMIRKVAGLIHLPHSDFIKMKQKARG